MKFSLFVYGIVQGVCELFPVSSSGHLILLSKFGGMPKQSLFMDVAVHFGSLGALVLYFIKDVWRLIRGFFHVLVGRFSPDTRFLGVLVFATLPVVIVGFVVDRYCHGAFRGLLSFGWASIIFGSILYVTDAKGEQKNGIKDISWKESFFGWGVAQCFALIHGASRSGVTISFGRAAGYKRVDATRFSFLMAIPTLTAASVLKGIQFYKQGNWNTLNDLGYTALVSFVTSLVFIWILLWWVRRFNFRIFGIYRIFLGIIILAGVYACGWS